MRNPLSKKVVEIQPSGIRKFFDIVSEMPDAISLVFEDNEKELVEIDKDIICPTVFGLIGFPCSV